MITTIATTPERTRALVATSAAHDLAGTGTWSVRAAELPRPTSVNGHLMATAAFPATGALSADDDATGGYAAAGAAVVGRKQGRPPRGIPR
ncbi:hypothetical protein SAMN05443575_0964 [Jatrophihabitans endophyticus]|uniref:Uncharacterized protein n=1 Tax=Jatrophihabitans endophyticus TaxID=1206085 RepID=A0A1M5EQ45_9ACTN|nr:hypothetical protein [Jatrophihabitans endophyticus]SHF81339.1 hypothetical protein SAMN05443575_0964 [Jatrophihabitans endophyticus]